MISVPRSNDVSERRDLGAITSPLYRNIYTDQHAGNTARVGGWQVSQTIESHATRRPAASLQKSRTLFIVGHDAIVEFLRGKWERELDYVLRKSLWALAADRIAVRFQYEWHDHADHWFSSYGTDLWDFEPDGLMRRREASINDLAIAASDRRYFAPRREDEMGVDLRSR